MATINKTIEQVDGMKPNTYGMEEKFRWLADLDGMIARVVMQMAEPVKYRYPEDLDKDLLVGAPFEEIYALYLQAQIDFHNQEYGHYNNTILVYDALFDEYKKAYIQRNRPTSAGCFKNLF